MAVTRIKNNQITDSTITGGKIASATLTGGLFHPTLSLSSNVSIVGNLTVTGTTSTVSSTNTFINDPLVVYNNGYTGSLSNYSIGMLVNRNLSSLADYGSVNMAWAWDEASGAFTAMATTDTGTGITSINNSGWGNVKLGNAEIVSKLTASNMVITTLEATNLAATTLVATNFSSGNAQISGGFADGFTIGANTAATATFTDVTSSGTATMNTVNAITTTSGTVNSTTGNVTTLTSTTVNAGTATAATLNSTSGNITTLTSTTVNAGTTTSATLNSTAGNITTLTSPTVNAGTTTTATLNATTGNVTTATAGSLAVSDLTNNRVVIAGTSGELEDDANLTYDGTTLTTNGLTATDVINTTLVATNFSSSNVDINGGAVDGTPIGAASASTGAFSTLTASGNTTVTSTQGSGNASSGALVVSGGVGIAENLHVGGDTVITGDLTVNGTTTYVNTTDLTVTDKNIEIADGSADANAADGAGITVDLGSDGTATITYTSADDSWNFNKNVNLSGLTLVTLNATNGNITTLSAPNFSSSNVQLTGGYADNVHIGANTAATGTFTTVDATTATVTTVNAGTTTSATLNATTGNITTATAGSMAVSDLTNNRVVIAGTSGELEDDANLTYDGTNLTTNGLVATSGLITTLDAGTTTSTTVNATTGNITTLTGTTATITTVNAGTTTSATVNATTGNVTTLTATNVINTTLVATNFSSSNVDINGGAIDGTAIGAASASSGAFTTLDASANLSVAGGALINTGQNANYDIKVSGVNDTSLIWARSASAYDAVLIGNSASASTFVSGAKLQINTTDSILLPTGTTAQRPGSVGGTDTTGMLRFNTSIGEMEFYDGSEWKTAGQTFTVIASDTFDGDDSTTGFTLGAAATTASVIVSINGVVQLPTTAYSVSSTTLTFTEAPATGDKIEVRRLTTTETVASLASPNGYVQVETDNAGVKFYSGAGAATLRWTINTDGDLIPAGNTTQDIGSSSAQIGAIYVAGGTIHLGDIQLKAEGGSLGIYESDGSTPAGSIVSDFVTGAQGDVRFMDADSSNFVAFQAPATVSSNVTWTLPSADAGTSGYALVSDGAGTLSWAAAGATISQDEATNTNFNLYFASTTSGALTAVKYDSGLSYNPSTGTLNVEDLVLSGDLTFNVTTTTVATTNTVVSDNLIELNNGAGSNANDSGIVIERGSTGDNAFIGWDESVDKFIVGTTTATGASTGDLTITAGTLVVSTLEGTTGTFSGNVSASHLNVTNSVQAATFNGATHTGTTGTFSGNVTASYFIGTATQSLYADVAENYQADKQYAAGTVVEFGGEHEVTVGQVEGSTRVAGIVSTNPAHLMNGGLTGTNVVAVALTGRVPCMVIGPVHKGDMMVSAGFGYAKASANPAVGSVVGKALENFDGDKGVIEVVVGRV